MEAVVDAIVETAVRPRRPVWIEGLDGFGDQLHQRAAVRQMLARGDEVWLTATAPCFYHDLRSARLHIRDGSKGLRSQDRNAAREISRFDASLPNGAQFLRARYNGEMVRRHGSVVAALCHSLGVTGHDFRMPVPADWIAGALVPIRPFILYRPPLGRAEYPAASARNPDPAAYAEIFKAVRADYQVVSVADIAPRREWIEGPEVDDAAKYHHGELDLEQIAALAARASFVFATPGFLTVLAQAVEAACVTVFGGYETAVSFSGGARAAPWLPVEPLAPCGCWDPSHACDKRIDVDRAIDDVRAFLEMNVES